MASTMLTVTTPGYRDPSGYELTSLPRPLVLQPTDVVLRVHAASINPVDVKKAGGHLKMVMKETFPYPIGFDCAGVVTEVGNEVTRIKAGDEVYVRLPEADRGSWAEYAKCSEKFIALKPKNLTFADASSIPLAAMTALQAFRKYKGSLAGKTVFIPAGLSGTGAYAIQLAKNVFRAGKIITTVSTAKVALVPQLLGEGVVDQVIDYTKSNPLTTIPRGSVDFILDTTGQAMTFLSLMVPKTSRIISISTTPSGTQLQESGLMRRPDNPRLPWWALFGLNAADAVRKLRARRWSVEYAYMFLDPNAEDLETLREVVEEGKLRAVVVSKVSLRDIEKVREACWNAYRGKGGVGKAVIEVIKE